MAATLTVAAAAEAPTAAATPAPTTAATTAPAADAAQDAVEVEDQPLVNGAITVAEIYASQNGWMVVHVDDNGKPGDVIGEAAVKRGETKNVVVQLREPVAVGSNLWPMLHIDAGVLGT